MDYRTTSHKRDSRGRVIDCPNRKPKRRFGLGAFAMSALALGLVLTGSLLYMSAGRNAELNNQIKAMEIQQQAVLDILMADKGETTEKNYATSSSQAPSHEVVPPPSIDEGQNATDVGADTPEVLP